MKKIVMLVIALFVINIVGCAPPKLEVFEEITNNETAFVIQLEGDKQAKLDSFATLQEMQVSTKRINVPLRWKKTGRMWYSGIWIPTVKVIKVDRSPITREWTAESSKGTSKNDEGIWIESSDSIAFSTGFNCTAKIEEKNAALFLYNYPNGQLSKIMDAQIRNEIQSIAADTAAKYPMDDCRKKKTEIIAEVRKIVIPKFEESGITVTTIGMFGGFAYEDVEIQQSINKTFMAQQEKVISAANLEAQNDINRKIELEAEAIANAVVTKAKGEGDAIREVAKASEEAASNPVFLELKKLELEMERVKVWDGKYPAWYMGGGSSNMGLIVSPPSGK